MFLRKWQKYVIIRALKKTGKVKLLYLNKYIYILIIIKKVVRNKILHITQLLKIIVF